MKVERTLPILVAMALAAPAAAHDLPRVEPIERSQQTYPNLSPDGRHMLYSAGEGFTLNLYLRDMESGEITQLTDNAFEDSAASWSPDGQWIAFQRQYADDNENRDIWLIRADGSDARNFSNTPDVSEQHPRFMPDGESLLYDGNRDDDGVEGGNENYEIYRASHDGGDPVRLTDNAHWDLYGTPSPDGRSMAWVRALPIDDKDDADYDVFVMDFETGESGNLSDHPRYDTNPDWSPDGEWIAFASDRMSSLQRRTDLYIVRRDGSDLTRLTDNGGTSMLYMRPRFSPDGRSLIASRVVAGRADMVRLDLSDILD